MTCKKIIMAAGFCAAGVSGSLADGGSSIRLEVLGTYQSGIFDASAAEILDYDEGSERLFVTNDSTNSLDVLDISDPANPVKAFSIDLSPLGAGVNSVAVRRRIVAVAVEADPKQLPGKVGFFDSDGNFLSSVTVGALPDNVVFTPNGKALLVANEGEPSDDYSVDPEGSVSIIRMRKNVDRITQADVETADFRRFNDTPIDPRIRIFGPGATVAQDLEPEYIAVSKDSETAWVTLQENNAIGIINIRRAKVRKLVALGAKDHSLAAKGLDASNKDGTINIQPWPVFGLYMPDTIASFRDGGKDFLITANEGDSRDYGGFSEEQRVKDLALGPAVFPDAAALQLDENLGRLKTTTASGDADQDGLFERIYAYGGRSYSIWNRRGRLVFDSGDQVERVVAEQLPDDFNSTKDENDSFDDRSDDKGPEPEALTVGKAYGTNYAFLGLERVGGIMVIDLSKPRAPTFVQYINNRDFAGDPTLGTAGDLAPEGMHWIKRKDSPIDSPLLVVSNEVSGTTTIYQAVRVRKEEEE